MSDLSVQQKYSPKSICFGCGPANEKGLRINSFPEGDELVMEFHAKPEHQAFPGMLNGGIIGATSLTGWQRRQARHERSAVACPPLLSART